MKSLTVVVGMIVVHTANVDVEVGLTNGATGVVKQIDFRMEGTNPGLPRVREKSGKLKFFQGQGIVREFCKLSGKFGNTVKCQEIVREF